MGGGFTSSATASVLEIEMRYILTLDKESVFITEFEGAKVGLVVLALEQRGLVAGQQRLAHRAERHGGDLGTGP